MSLNHQLADIAKPYLNERVQSMKIDSLTASQLVSTDASKILSSSTSDLIPTFLDLTLLGLTPNTYLTADAQKLISSSFVYQPPGNAFLTGLKTSQVIPMATQTAIQFTSISVNTFATLLGLTNSNSRFIYTGSSTLDLSVSFTVVLSSGSYTGDVILSILKNGGAVPSCANTFHYASAVTPAVSGTATIRLNNNDYIECFIDISGGDTVQGSVNISQIH